MSDDLDRELRKLIKEEEERRTPFLVKLRRDIAIIVATWVFAVLVYPFLADLIE